MKKSQLERMLKTEKEMREHFEDLFNTAIKELQFNNMRFNVLLNGFEEVKQLLADEVDNEIIIKVMTNYLERVNLDTDIHNNLIGNASSDCGVN